MRKRKAPAAAPSAESATVRQLNGRSQPVRGGQSSSRKLSYREQREFEELPLRIEALEAEQRTLGGTIADPKFYKQPAATIAAALERAESIERELGALYVRWDALDSRA